MSSLAATNHFVASNNMRTFLFHSSPVSLTLSTSLPVDFHALMMVAERYYPPLFSYCYLLVCFRMSVAPMIEWIDNHYRTLAGRIAIRAWLYTEMLAAETIVFQKDNLMSIDRPWHTLAHVETDTYGAPRSSITRRQILKEYQAYVDSVIGMYGKKPNLRDLVKPLFGLFHSEPGNGLWKWKADAALQRCTTMKSFSEETLDAIPDRVLDSAIAGAPCDFTNENTFANVRDRLPPPYDVIRKYEVVSA